MLTPSLGLYPKSMHVLTLQGLHGRYMDEMSLQAPVTAWHVLLLPLSTEEGSQEEVDQLPTVWTWGQERPGMEFSTPDRMS